jgi:hypothetical protein
MLIDQTLSTGSSISDPFEQNAAIISDLPSGAEQSSMRVPWQQVLGFSGLAYALSWLWWAPLVWPHLSLLMLTEPLPNTLANSGAGRAAFGMLGPAMAALIMRRLHRKPQRGSLGARRPWQYYVIAVVAPALFVASVVVVDTTGGLAQFEWPQSAVATFATVLFVGGLATLPLTLGEEYGWRGYLLPRLLPLGEVRATFVLAAIWGVWHLPMLLIGLNYPGQRLWAVAPVFLVTVALTAFPFTWLYVASGGGVLAVAVMHAVLNALSDTFTSSRYLPDGNPLVVGAGGLVGAAILLAMVAVGRLVGATLMSALTHGATAKLSSLPLTPHERED